MKFEQPFVIAEMSGNHNQSLEKALKIIDAAAEAGASAIKIQTYTADTITLKGVFTITQEDSLWYGKDLYELYSEAHTPWEWHKPIFDYAKQKGIICFSSPFDETAVDLLEALDNPIYKVASFEVNHIPMLKRIAATGKPVIMSTGASSLAEIEEAVNVLRSNNSGKIILLKCTSTYPASPENSNILTIPHMSEMFECEVGLSDHTMGIGVAVASVGLGANFIEKHFCLDRSEGGVDSAFSLEPAEFKLLVEETKRAFEARGKITYGIIEAEAKVSAGKRSIYVSRNIKAGEKFTSDNIKVIRPGFGLHPRYYEDTVDKIAARDLEKGTPLSFQDISN